MKFVKWVRYQWNFNIKYWHRDIQYGIENLVKWFYIVWTDRNWDHIYIYRIFRHKLHLMEQNIRIYGNHINHIDDANKIRKCVFLLDRLSNDVYDEIAFKKYHEKWGEGDFEFLDTDNPELKELNINYATVKTKKDEKQRSKEFSAAGEAERNLREQDLEMLFTLMRKHIQTWWD